MEKFNLLNLNWILAARSPESHWWLISKGDERQSGLLIFIIVEIRSGWHWKRDEPFVGAAEIEKPDIVQPGLIIAEDRSVGFLLLFDLVWRM
jgi:hypothetical protein